MSINRKLNGNMKSLAERLEDLPQRRRYIDPGKVNKPSITDAQAQFVEEYFVDYDEKAAALRAGLKPGSSATKRESVREEIARKRKHLSEKLGITQERVLQEMSSVAYARLTDFMDLRDGIVYFRDFERLTDEQKAAIESVQLYTDKDGITRISRIKLHNKGQCLENISKHLGLFEKDNKQKSEVNITVDEILSGLPSGVAEAVRKKLVKETDNQTSIH